jgi:long-subunit acyl-CoA synthetase (AMP-forming)/GNAT superfamily N-acetyltransferase
MSTTRLDDPQILRALAPGDAADHLSKLLEALESGAQLELDAEAFLVAGETLAGVARRHDAASAPDSLGRAARAWLDIVRRRPMPERIAEAGLVDRAFDAILALIDAGRFTVGRLFEQRVDAYGPRTLFTVPSRGREGEYSWLETSSRVDRVARGLLARLGPDARRGPVALVADNSYEMAVADLACLGAGIVNVMIPPNTTEKDTLYVLERTGARLALFSGDGGQRKLLTAKRDVASLEEIFRIDSAPRHADVATLDDLIALGARLERGELSAARETVTPDDLATIMVTSGTTGRPKGIRFSQRNLVTKRFARSLAIPKIGDRDVFLSYLPLYHTFGRYLEMLGAIFWGASYVFMEDPSVDTMLERFATYEPSVFISIPLKWIQLRDEIGRRVDLEHDSDAKIERATRDVVGPRLSWGLSAAGYLDPEIFRFFQSQGVELMSGFGMTEATGGITMTPPGGYREDSLGVPLPGIDVRLADDGELEIHGPYVMLGYLEAEDEKDTFVDGWLCTGDLFTLTEEGHYRILDRKKEIYKNVKGQTIAPQRIEKLFVDFDAAKRVFLVGDHREYNTLLIVPNEDVEDVPLREMSEEAKREYFRSLVVSVNRFLAPYERIVDFDLLDRDFDAERGELTPKGTYRRRTIADNFAPIIDRFYKQVPLRLPGRDLEVRLPNRLFQVLGVTARDVEIEEGRLVIRPANRSLRLEALGPDGDAELVRIGSFVYRVRGRTIDLGQMMTCAALWLGNGELVDLTPMEAASRMRRRQPPKGVEVVRRAEPARLDRDVALQLRRAAGSETLHLDDLHLAAMALHTTRTEVALAAVEMLAAVPPMEEASLTQIAHLALRSASDAPLEVARRHAFCALLPLEEDARAEGTIASFMKEGETLLDESAIRRLATSSLSSRVVRELVRYADRDIGALSASEGEEADSLRRRVGALLRLLGRYGAEHPAAYRDLRRELARIAAFTEDDAVRGRAAEARRVLVEGFRRWLGPPQWIAVDSETGREYRWHDALTFEEEMPDDEKERIEDAVRSTSLVREAAFLVAGGQTVRLSDIPPQGIWISVHRRETDRSTMRATVHTRFQGSFDFAIGFTRELDESTLETEIDWAIIAGESDERPRLVEEMAGSWPERGVWTKEFIGGETVERSLRRLERRRGDDGVERQAPMWPFMVWSASEAFFEFWKRTGRRYVLEDASASNVVVPTHDYQVGARLVSVASRARAPKLAQQVEMILERLVRPVEEAYPHLSGLAGPKHVLSALCEAIGPEEGLRLIEAEMEGASSEHADAIRTFGESVRRRGFISRRLYFAIERYRRWIDLASDATAKARAKTVQDLYDTYNLASLLGPYPESRVRFFRETVFRDEGEPIGPELDELIDALRFGKLDKDDVIERIGALGRRGDVDDDAEFLLTRLTFPHLRPGDTAGFVSAEWGGVRQSDVVVTLRDNSGRPFHVRHPVTPKEVGRLHRLFLSSRMEVSFSPEHHFLVAVNDRGHLIGGLFYDVDDEANRRAHLEKIVVAERYRRLGVADGLMSELFSRLTAQGFRYVTTGFYRPSYFYRHGFRVERRYAGLVRELTNGVRGVNGSEAV